MEQKSAIKEMVKMKKQESGSILKDKERSGKEDSWILKDKICPEMNVEIEKINPQIDPMMAKELFQKFESRSFLCNSKDPIEPAANNESKIRKLN